LQKDLKRTFNTLYHPAFSPSLQSSAAAADNHRHRHHLPPPHHQIIIVIAQLRIFFFLFKAYKAIATISATISTKAPVFYCDSTYRKWHQNRKPGATLPSMFCYE